MFQKISIIGRIRIAAVITVLAVAGVLLLLWPQTEKTKITTDKIPGDNGRGVVIEGKNNSRKPGYLQTNSSAVYQSQVIDSPKPQSNAAILHWKQQDNNGEVVAAFRLFDGNRWSKWVESSSEDDRKDNTPVPHSALVIGNQIHKVQYRFEVFADQQSALSPEVELDTASIELVDTTKGPSLSKHENIISAILQNIGLFQTAKAHTSDPHIITRAEWGAPEPNSSDRWTPEYRPLEHVIVHHTAVATEGDSAASIRAVWHYHANSLGWGDIGYNYLVDSAGNIFQGRYYDQNYAEKNSEDVVGGHALSYNYGSTGIAALGNFTSSQPSGAMLNSISDLAAFKLYRYGVSPDEWRGGFPVVAGHRDVIQTSCPGTIHDHLTTIRTLATTEYHHYIDRPFSAANYEVIKAMDSPATYLALDNQLRPIASAGQRDCFIMAYIGRMRSVTAGNVASIPIGSAADICNPPNYTWYYPENSLQQYVLLYGGMYPVGSGDVAALGGTNKAHPLSDIGIQYLHDNYESPAIPGHILIKGATNPTVYEVNNDKLQHVNSFDTRDCLISQVGDIKYVPDSLIDSYQSDGKIIAGVATCTITTGQILHPDGMAVAQIVNGTRRYVGSPVLRDCIIVRTNTGYPYKVSQLKWDSFSSGPDAYCPYGSDIRFVRESSTPTVWRVFPDGRKQHADGFCVADPWTTPLAKYHVWIVPDSETSGHVDDGYFSATAQNCQSIT